MSFDGRIVKAIFFLPFTAAIGAIVGPMISLPVVGYEMLNDIEPETYSGPAWYIGLVIGIPLFAFLGWKTIYQKVPEDERFTIFGTARWANAKERKALTDPVDGLLLGRTTDKGQALLRYDGVAHLMTLAPTRSGKGVGTIIPNLLTANRSVICIDPKGENARVAGRRRETFGRVFTLDPFGVSGRPSAAFNPLDALDPRSVDLAEGAATIGAISRTPRRASSFAYPRRHPPPSRPGPLARSSQTASIHRRPIGPPPMGLFSFQAIRKRRTGAWRRASPQAALRLSTARWKARSPPGRSLSSPPIAG